MDILSFGKDELALATDWMDRSDFETYRLPGRKRFRMVKMA